MMITRKQLRDLILEATIDYVDNDGSRKAVKADGILSNNNLRLQLHGYYDDAYDKFFEYQNNLIGDQFPDLAKDLAHTSSFNQAKDEFQEYIENSVSSKYGSNASIKFGAQDFEGEVPNELLSLSQVIGDIKSKKVKYNPKFRDFPDPKRGEANVDFDDYEPLEFKTEPITAEDELAQIQRQADIEQRRREMGSDLSFMFRNSDENTIPRADYPDETTTPKSYMNLEDLLTGEEPPTWMSDPEGTEPPKGR